MKDINYDGFDKATRHESISTMPWIEQPLNFNLSLALD